MIPSPTQRMTAERAGSTLVEVVGGHTVHISQPVVVAGLVRQATT